MKEREALKLALEALDGLSEPYDVLKAQDAIKEVLAQPEQEPVAWMREGWGPDCGPYIEFYRDDEMGWRDRKEWTPLYTAPPQRTWVGLTIEEINEVLGGDIHDEPNGLLEFVRAIEAKLKAKNFASSEGFKEKNT